MVDLLLRTVGRTTRGGRRRRDAMTGEMVAEWQHHTGPVPQLLLPPPGADGAWADMVLSLGTDSTVGIISLGTMRLERCVPLLASALCFRRRCSDRHHSIHLMERELWVPSEAQLTLFTSGPGGVSGCYRRTRRWWRRSRGTRTAGIWHACAQRVRYW